MADLSFTRRSMLSAMAVAPVVIAVPTMAAVNTGSAEFNAIFAANDAAVRRFNSLPPTLEAEDEAEHQREQRMMIEASLQADRAIPTTWQELCRWIEHVSSDGESTIDEDNTARLLGHVKRLAGAVA